MAIVEESTVSVYGIEPLYGPVPVLLSVADTVNVNEPPSVGVPVSVPVGSSDKPAGSAPTVIANVCGDVPPLAVIDCEYATPTVAAGNVGGVTTIIGGVTFNVYELEALNGPVPVVESVTVTVKLNGPPAVGVPVNAPVGLNVKPVGNAPAVTLNAYDAIPPLAPNVSLYGAATAASETLAGVMTIAGGSTTSV
jgi:hypothetical protein